ncbi:calcineurin-like phosphoesterase C-terminal domain-containing protein [Pseudopedobacter beijingensis]|uniref:Calcineurin-like phosphoesterase C-terminal domain-containing protein n=1 Tax=Pseudopedobacter beijingensis TaxID=1207056 RepID=A0ABW4IAU5_9SPHI
MKRKTRLIIILCFLFLACKKESPKNENNEYNPLPEEEFIQLSGDNNTYGKISDTDNKPVSGVIVSDGYTSVQTDAKGTYQFKRNTNARFVFYSTPSNYEINTESNETKIPSFHKRVDVDNNKIFRADFSLKKLEQPENNFTLICIGDPQTGSTAEVNRFKNETIADIKQTLNSINTPVLGLSMGDVVADKDDLLLPMKSLLGSMEMPVFTTIGNHDKFTRTGGIKDGNLFSDNYGPLNYSFNYGDVHFICLDNVKFSDSENYTYHISDEQITWITSDLKFVPKQKMIIIFYHIPIRNSNFTNKTALFNLFKDYKEVHLMSGHTHYNQNYIHTSPKNMYEHIHAAACGAWWKSTINGDGTPNGYAVYNINGPTIDNWYYKSVNYDKSFQLRLHWGNASFGGEYGNFGYGLSNKTLIANVWNADPDWKIEVYENGIKSGNMTLNTSLNKDAWSLGYHLGILNRNPTNYTTTTMHLYSYTLNNPNATVKVIATDRFGNIYEQDKITTDLLAAISYQ